MASPSPSSHYRFGEFELQLDERQLLKNGRAVALRPQALEVLWALVDRAGHLITKDQLMQRVWGKVIVEENTLQAHVSALRKVFGPGAIATVSGQGYRFAIDVVPVRERPPRPNHNLPQQLTSFIGRTTEIAQIKQLLSSTRLLTLTGAGGCGKTRLALQVAATAFDDYPDGAWLVELAPLLDSTHIVQTVAKALSVEEQAGKDLGETLIERVEQRSQLLLLDNAEHVLDACAELADRLLRRCPRMVVLVTSRERLGIAGEVTYRVPSLSVPEARDGTTRDAVLNFEATRLFIERARLQCPDFDVTGTEAVALGSICRRLDGIALAIELAAPRVRVMSLEELSQRIDDRFVVLTGGPRTALPRHRTLRSLVDWSHDLLGNDEKAVLRRASVFTGGWTLDAAEQVCSGERVQRSAVLDLLTSLTDKNLVAVETHGSGTRFGMLETVRHYARDRLRESGEEGPVCDRHLQVMLDMASTLVDPMQTDSELRSKLLRLDQEHDNVRAALAWSETSPARTEKGLGLAGELHWFWRMRGHYGEARGWIARLLALGQDGDRTEAHASAFHAIGALMYLQGDYSSAEARHREALDIWKRLGNRRGVARSLNSLGSIARSRGELSAARELYHEALSIARELGDRRSVSMNLECLGTVAHAAGNHAAAQALLEECVFVSRDIGTWRVAIALAELGRVRHSQGDLEAARSTLVKAFEGHRELGDKPGIAETLIALATVAHDQGDVESEGEHLRAALDIVPTGDKLSQVTWLEAFAGFLAQTVGATYAARLWGCTQRAREQIGSPMSTPECVRQEHLVSTASATLHDRAAFERAWNDGRTWTLDEGLHYAQKS